MLVRAFLGRQLPLQALVRRQAVAGVEVEAAEPAAVAQGVTVVVAVEAVVFLAGQRQAEVAVFQGDALAGVPVADAALARRVLQARAGRLAGGAGDDVDHPHQCVGAVADGIRPTEHFDPLDILEGQRQVAPVDAGKARAVHRAAVDQHLQAPRPRHAGAVVVDRGLVAGQVADHHARDQAHQFGNVAGAAGDDQLAVEHADAAGNFRRGLFQACRGQYFGNAAGIVEQVGGRELAAEQQGQQGQGGGST